MPPLRIEFNVDLTLYKCSCLLTRKKGSHCCWNDSWSPFPAALFPWRWICQINGIGRGSSLLLAAIDKIFPSPISIALGMLVKGSMPISKKPAAFLSYQFLFNCFSVYSSSQPFVLISNSVVLCPPFLYGRESVNKTHHKPNIWKNTFKIMNGKQNQGYC